MESTTKWGLVLILGVFVLISWGVRAMVSQHVSNKVLDKEAADKEE